MIILKVTKEQSFAPYEEDKVFEKLDWLVKFSNLCYFHWFIAFFDFAQL